MQNHLKILNEHKIIGEDWLNEDTRHKLLKYSNKIITASGKLNIVEIGSWKGRSSIFILNKILKNKEKLTCIDTWTGSKEHQNTEDLFDIFKENLDIYALFNRVNVIKDTSSNIKEYIKDPVDLFFLDGNHEYRQVLEDLNNCFSLLKPGGYIVGDDFSWNVDTGVKYAVADFISNNYKNATLLEANYSFVIKKEIPKLPLISVTMLTYERKELFKKTVDSFLNKVTYPNLEFLVWVNKSDEEYEDLINSYGTLFTFKHFSDDNKGIGVPRNILHENCNGKYILNLEDDWECTASPEDNFLERSVKVLEKNPDVGQVVLRDIPMEGYADAEIGELRDDCYVMINRYSHMSPTFTNQVNLAPKAMYDALGPFEEKNQETSFGKLYDKKYVSVKLGHTADTGFFHHIGMISAASEKDSKELGTYFCGNPRKDITHYDHVGVIRFSNGEEEFVDCMIQEMLPIIDKIIITESNCDVTGKYRSTLFKPGNILYNKYINNEKIKYVLIDKRYFKDITKPFSNNVYKDAINYNLGNAAVYKAIEINKITANWFYVFDGDEIISTENFKLIKSKLQNYNSEEYKAFAVPTTLYSKYINGKLEKNAFTPLCIMSGKAFNIMEGNRGIVIPPMTAKDWSLIDDLPNNTLQHFGHVFPKNRIKHNINIFPNHSTAGTNADYLDQELIKKIDIGTLASSIINKTEIWKKQNLLYPKKVDRSQTICLHMIVKDEAMNLIRYHSKLADYIDEYIIVDTGSTDNTKETIKKIFSGVPGQIIDHPFDDYASCRNTGLDLIKSDWILILDADHELDGDFNFLNSLPKDSSNVISMNWVEKDYSLLTRRLVRNTGTLRWSGKAHELLKNSDGWNEVFTNKIKILHHNTGSGKFNKFERELKLLISDWEENKVPRTCFYIGCDNYWAKNYDEAIKWFLKYNSLTDNRKWDEEIYKTTLYLGRCYQKLNNVDEALNFYNIAHELRPHLAEPRAWASEIMLQKQDYQEAVRLTEAYFNTEYPKNEVLWFEREVYDKTISLILSIASWYIGRKELGKKACLDLISKYPNNELYKSNLKYYE